MGMGACGLGGGDETTLLTLTGDFTLGNSDDTSETNNSGDGDSGDGDTGDGDGDPGDGDGDGDGTGDGDGDGTGDGDGDGTGDGDGDGDGTGDGDGDGDGTGDGDGDGDDDSTGDGDGDGDVVDEPCPAYATLIEMCYGPGIYDMALQYCNMAFEYYGNQYGQDCVDALEAFIICLSQLDCLELEMGGCEAEGDAFGLACS